MLFVNDTPSPKLLKELRARLVLDGLSLTIWAQEHDVRRQNLAKALTGEWTGPKAQNLVSAAIAHIGSGRVQ